jgi:hypothetical protein
MASGYPFEIFKHFFQHAICQIGTHLRNDLVLYQVQVLGYVIPWVVYTVTGSCGLIRYNR